MNNRTLVRGGAIAVVVVGLLLVSFVAASYFESSSAASNPVSTTTAYVSPPPSNTTNALGLNTIAIYNATRSSVVTVQGAEITNSFFGQQAVSILGSGFVVQYKGADYIVTNDHVAGSASNLTVTFSDGNAYAAKVIGTDPYSDLAVLSVVNTPASEFHSLNLTISSNLEVGEPVVAIGNPFGLSGSMTYGIISQLGRTIQDPTAGNFPVADTIQFSAPINPGNSGGPLLNANGNVIGITTAIVSGSQGVGFAIPSDTIMRELPSLIVNGTYTQHSYLGISGTDMNFQLAKSMGSNVTYGVLVENVLSNSPAARAGLRAGSQTVTIDGTQYLIGGDVIVSINGTKITGNQALAAYLEEYTLPGQTISFGIVRNGSFTTVHVVLGTRPPISSS